MNAAGWHNKDLENLANPVSARIDYSSVVNSDIEKDVLTKMDYVVDLDKRRSMIGMVFIVRGDVIRLDADLVEWLVTECGKLVTLVQDPLESLEDCGSLVVSSPLGLYRLEQMDSNEFSKRQHGCEDIISNMPDFIIGHILSFLPTKEAVQTSVLSKRWIYMWTFITELRFDDKETSYSSKKKSYRQDFIDLVYKVLLHLNVSSLQGFSLVIHKKYDSSTVNAWICAVLSQGVKKLCVDSHQNLSLSFHSLPKCKPLEELTLTMYHCVIKVPSFVCLPYLKFLKLSDIAFASDFTSNTQEWNLNFPVLVKFETQNCTWSSITLTAPQLESISILRSTFKSLNSVTKFGVSRLKEFIYRGFILQDTILLDPSSTHNTAAVEITVYPQLERLQESSFRSCLLVKQFNQMKSLKIQGTKVLAGANLADLPAFGMLTHLELGTNNGQTILGLLLKAPFLKTLALEGISVFDKEILNSTIVPDCLLSTLKVMKFGNFYGFEHELRFAKFIMENAKVIETIKFHVVARKRHTRRLYSRSAMRAVMEKLSSFNRGSRFAIMEFTFAY
ncbi:F-box/FBD/LRR-repeat protein At3g14710-like [Gastrolobium bilobum]|uniref:F-box/FBD/LRR-repeat protein At3g14710-like n=1 Tax=Gastrolobium bilobum TaxID=150636 RepID=UPI002AB1F01C|nr:F-box/FBD/LRR-repeat protein At3g14710-like [Gastrolobium bilobum]